MSSPPTDRPRWSLPLLAALAAAAGFAYAWRATGNLEIYYAAAVRSMSASWHDFAFAAFDPAGTITLDKLPGAFWVQALSVRVFGLHAWAIVLPQIVEGVACVLVLHRVVRRLTGSPAAGLLAAAVLVVSPATVLTTRGNVPDTLMVLLLLLAAERVVSAILTGRRRGLVAAAVLVGLAFQAKMLEAWLVLPALAVAYAVGAECGLGGRLRRLGASGVVVGAVSLCWMALVALWPAGSRPYVDGSASNSIFGQVFVYNGLGRLDQASPNQLLGRAIGLRLSSPPPGWDRLLTGAIGRETSWLIPAALISLACLLAAVRSLGRLERAAVGLWGTWLIVLLVAFSASSTINPYYTTALSPAIAGLIGTGLVLGWRRRESLRARLACATAVAVGSAYGAWLLPSHGVGLVAGLRVGALAFGAAAVLLLLLAERRLARGAVALAVLAGLAVPALASGSAVGHGLGPFDTPFEHLGEWRLARALGSLAARTVPLVAPLERARGAGGALMATQTAAVAAPFIYDSGQEVVPIGGFSGAIPEPSLRRLESMISAGEFHIVIQAPSVSDPRLVWVQSHCLALRPGGGAAGRLGLRLAVYYCGAPSFL